MPVPWIPNYEEWKKTIESYPITENSLLVGHSCGAAFLVRWLLETNRKVKKLILVAPAYVPEKIDNRKSLYDFEIPPDGSRIADEIVIFISNDREHIMKSFELYKASLKARIVNLENKGHFLIFTMGTNEFPELLEEILR
jgi:predicted alpha/beta hydrolase family esterase